MLDDFKISQPIVYKILKNAIKNDKYSHAYLIETGNFYDYLNFTKAFVKSLLCPKKKLKKENCGECHQCEVIDSGNFPEIEIIKPDGIWIKKDQLQNLQKEFNTKALIGTKRVYIINGAEKLNKSSANSILKFLEEPDNDIVAILLTNNIYNVLSTIRSRCQILKLKATDLNNLGTNKIDKIKKITNISSLDDETLNTKITKIIEFINYYEKNHLTTLLYMNKLWNENITSKDEMILAFEIMITYYKDILNYQLKKKTEIFDIDEQIKTISTRNTITEICDKINKIVELKEKIKFNANSALLMDKLILTLEGEI